MCKVARQTMYTNKKIISTLETASEMSGRVILSCVVILNLQQRITTAKFSWIELWESRD